MKKGILLSLIYFKIWEREETSLTLMNKSEGPPILNDVCLYKGSLYKALQPKFSHS